MKNLINNTKLKLNISCLKKYMIIVVAVSLGYFLLLSSSTKEVVKNTVLKLEASIIDNKLLFNGKFNRKTTSTIEYLDMESNKVTKRVYEDAEDIIYETKSNSKQYKIDITVKDSKESFIVTDKKKIKQELNLYNESKKDKNIIVIFVGTFLSIFGLILFGREFILVNQLSKEQRKFLNIRKNIINNYSDQIVVSENKINFDEKYTVNKILKFENLVNIANKSKEQIIYYEEEQNKNGLFFLIKGNEVFIYELRV